MGQHTVDRMLHQDTVNETVPLGHSRWDRTQQTRQFSLHYEIVDLIIILEHTRHYKTVNQMVNWNTVVRTVTLAHSRWDNYVRTQLMGKLYQDTLDRTHQDIVDGTVTTGHIRDSYV